MQPITAHHDPELHHMLTSTLTLVEAIDVNDPQAAMRRLAELDDEIESIHRHITLVDALVLPVIEHTEPGSTVGMREMHGIVARELSRVLDRSRELAVAVEEARAYSDELAVDLYLALASLAIRSAPVDSCDDNERSLAA